MLAILSNVRPIGNIGRFIFNHLVSQALGFASSILIIRTYSVAEYGAVGVIFAALNLIAQGADLGLSSAAAHFWHKYQASRIDQCLYIGAALAMRNILFLVASLVAIAFEAISLRGLVPLISVDMALVAISTCAAAWMHVRFLIASQLVRLAGEETRFYRANTGSGILKMVLAFALLQTSTQPLWAPVAIFGLGSTLAFILLKGTTKVNFSDYHLDFRNGEARRAVQVALKYSVPLLPGTIFYVGMAPALISLASTSNIPASELGAYFAMERLAIPLAVLAAVNTYWFNPRLAASPPAQFQSMARRSLAVVCAFVGAVFVAASFIAPFGVQVVLPLYAEHTVVAILVFATASVAVISGFINSVVRIAGRSTNELRLALVCLAALALVGFFADLTSAVALAMAGLVLQTTLLLGHLIIVAPLLKSVPEVGRQGAEFQD